MLRLTVLLLCLQIGNCLALGSYAQQKTFTFRLENRTLAEVLREIEKQSEYVFFYADRDIDLNRRVSIEVKGQTIDRLLEELFRKSNNVWQLNDRQVIIRKAGQKQTAEEMVVNGLVRDEKGQPMPGVTVLLKGTSFGVSTDHEGHYRLRVPDLNQTLVFTFVGMKTREIAIGGKTEINVTLHEEIAEMDEVVVTGYFNKSKNSFTGAVTSAKREELRKFGNVNLIQALSMVDPSFKIKENNTMGSDPNSLPDFFVRGESSFMGESNIPTFIVDGYEVTLQRVFDMDLDRIESITVLKDASATILYGSRAANGVVVIETRRPAGGKLQVSYSNRTSLSVADLSDYNLMDAKEKLDYELATGEVYADNLNSLKILEENKAYIASGVNTDWLAQPIRHAVSHAHSLYVDGGSEAVIYGLGLNYNRKAGVMKESYREVFGASFDLTYRIRDKVSIRNSFEFSQTNVHNSPYGSFSQYAQMNPYYPIHDEDGKLIRTYTPHSGAYNGRSWYRNPLYNATLPYKDESGIETVSDNLNIDWWILPELRFKGTVALTKTTNSSDKFLSPDNTEFSNETNPAKKGSYEQGTGKGFSYNINATLNYNMSKQHHNLFAGVGLNLIQNRTKNATFRGLGFMDGRFCEVWFATGYDTDGKPTGNETEDRMAGFFANVNYSFDDRYFADLSGRVDGSSKYGKEKRFAPLWSVGAGWNIHREHFMEGMAGWLSRLTLRASIGETGNQNFDPYQARTTLAYKEQSYFDGMGATFKSYGNTRLEWQTSLKRNIGLDFEVMQRRLALRVEYYNDRTDGLLLPVSVTPSLGFEKYTENFGEQKNKGYEFDLNAVLIRHKDFDLAVNFSGTHNENRISKISSALRALNKDGNELGPEPDRYNDPDAWREWDNKRQTLTSPIAMYEEGESVNAIKAVRSLGINPASGQEYFLTRDGKATTEWNYLDKVVVGCTDPKLEGNIGANVMWKNWQLTVTMRYSFGAQQYNTTLASRVEGAQPFYNADKRVLQERWQRPGDRTFFKNIADRGVTSNATSRFVQDYNYLEMSNISLSYRLPQEWLKKIGFSSARIGLNTGDLFYVSSIKRERGTDYPFAREFTFSLNLNF